jgi:hypothetical protein
MLIFVVFPVLVKVKAAAFCSEFGVALAEVRCFAMTNFQGNQ